MDPYNTRGSTKVDHDAYEKVEFKRFIAAERDNLFKIEEIISKEALLRTNEEK
jgi:hypothetical protein